MKTYKDYVDSISKLVQEAKTVQLGGVPPIERKPLPADAPVGLIFSPHPDDECITGVGSLRLMQENGIRIKNVVVTQGSNTERQAPRFKEVSDACNYLGFGVIQTAPGGLLRVRPTTRENNPQEWAEKVAVIKDIILREKPVVIAMPHAKDWNSAHIGTHFVVEDALRQMPKDYSVTVIETEFWGELENPNLMLEVTEENLARMITALSFHFGEVARNPYHLLLPAYMQRNVCRGAEVVGGQGGDAPQMNYAIIYRLSRYANGTFTPASNRIVKASEKINLEF